jgi:Arc/MetJ-type ribon-helix-helix transcriptional regulator
MSQVNLRVDVQFEKDLFAVMAAMRIASKSQAIRFAVREMADAIGRSNGRDASAQREVTT